MPFIAQNWAVVSQSSNIPQRTLQTGTIIGAPGLYTYQSHTETLATIASDVTYFSPVDVNLAAGDLIYIVGSDASAEFTVLDVDPATGNVIIAQNAGSGNVIGPGTSTNDAVVRFNGTTGQLIQNSVAILSDAGALRGLTGLTSSGLTYPTADAGAGAHMVTDGAGNLSLVAPGGGGDVFGPSSSTDNSLSRFDGTTGKLIQNSDVTLSDIGAMAGLTAFQTAAATIGALNYATIDGAAGNHMITDGAGNLSLAPPVIDGDVFGPSSSTDNHIARFSGTTGKLIQDGSVAILSDSGALSGLTALTVGALAYPIVDATAGFVVTTNGSGVLSLQPNAGGSGDVVGPASATNNALATFNTTTGKLIQNSVAILDGSGNLSGLNSLSTTIGFSIASAGSAVNLVASSGHQLQISSATTAVTIGGGGAGVISTSNFVISGSNSLLFDAPSSGTIEFTLASTPDADLTYNWPVVSPTAGQILSASAPVSTVSQLSWVTATGTGNVVGPSSATNNAIATFNTTTGQLIQNSLGILDTSGNLSGLNSLSMSIGLSITNVSGTVAFNTGSHELVIGSTSFITIGGGAGGVFTTSNFNIGSSQTLTFLSPAGTNNVLFALTTNPSASITYDLPFVAPTAGQVLSAAAPVANVSQLSWATGGGGSGDVVGPASSVDKHLVTFDGTTGKLIQDNSSVVLSNTSQMSGLASLGTAALTVNALTYPTTDATSGYVVTTNGAGVLSLQPSTSSGFSPLIITSNTSAIPIANDQMAINNATGSGVTTILLPDESVGHTVAIGDEFRVVGGTCTGGWILVPAAGQTVIGGTSVATTSVQSTNQYDQISLVAITASPGADFVIISNIGVLNYT